MRYSWAGSATGNDFSMMARQGEDRGGSTDADGQGE
jgi:hypothetical protein